ncbi:dTDP-4-dehydrorhamnose reductase [Companilactobacillus kimchii]|uniref:dTDP-4-dehydrorhamnose reductase n=2 Tax=Companilactobacillus kimchii TaxID=2801452 RepID=A0ABR5NWE5_9LACO|nr:dTDP-4-dehydrorhamnose reductase [Companilactobacillus kimchii]GEO48547.1 NAD(P)-dependent oxidoreductase [Companilactobacillus paralimentarius]KAE9559739.1 NAD(P)-dependent oxidoreductase [Companilactobacillus kimchii]KAE9561363.1 NAD(P)-dependent oxidoreductase [Companilactobacillus kimchii]KRK53056.1 dTDP-4-dehydrorhamnose reductase [Companilactobacillus kimchii DSM 13961 = JCM 10707]OWF31906.1 dTDP-4-dehydrorhamnose reductase [Companilactobacillus kimchii]
MKVLVIGASGQLGSELCRMLDKKGIEYLGTNSKDLDITDWNAVNQYFKEYRPQLVYNCAAYTNVDGAEDTPGKIANYKVNVIGTKNVAAASEKFGATLIYISTDYVFDGNNSEMYTEKSPTNPQNEYGRAKLAGEQAVSKIMSKYYIIRTSWVFGEYGKNFVYTMLNLAKTHDHLTVVNDQKGRPTWTKTLSEFMIYAMENEIPYGLYQLSNEESCTWYEFAKEILKEQNVKIDPVTSDEFPQRAYRPKHSVMDLAKAESVGFEIISWKEALSNFINDVN